MNGTLICPGSINGLKKIIHSYILLYLSYRDYPVAFILEQMYKEKQE
jgi:hypothetical protein